MNEHRGKDDSEYLLCEYLDGQLDREGEAELQDRLTEDPKLREQLRAYAVLKERLDVMGDAELRRIDYDAQRREIMKLVERRALLSGVPRRRLILRAVLATFAAAAVLIILAPVATLIFRASPDATDVPRVTVSILPEAPLTSHRAEAMVSVAMIEVTEAIAPVRAGRGTVVVSFLGDAEIPAGYFPAEVFGIE